MQLTNTDDLTDAGVASTLTDIAGFSFGSQNGFHWKDMNRDLLARLVMLFDFASPNWPQTVLGLPEPITADDLAQARAA